MADAARAKTYTEIATLVLAKGDPSALDGLTEKQVTRRTVARAVTHLRDLGRADLADALQGARLGPARPAGVRLPAAGEHRSYDVQSVKGHDFARIPTKPIGRTKGQAVVAHFHADREKLGEWAEEHVGDSPFIVLVPKEPE